MLLSASQHSNESTGIRDRDNDDGKYLIEFGRFIEANAYKCQYNINSIELIFGILQRTVLM